MSSPVCPGHHPCKGKTGRLRTNYGQKSSALGTPRYRGHLLNYVRTFVVERPQRIRLEYIPELLFRSFFCRSSSSSIFLCWSIFPEEGLLSAPPGPDPPDEFIGKGHGMILRLFVLGGPCPLLLLLLLRRKTNRRARNSGSIPFHLPLYLQKTYTNPRTYLEVKMELNYDYGILTFDIYKILTLTGNNFLKIIPCLTAFR